MQISSLEELLTIKYDKKMRLVVVGSHDEEVLEAVWEARRAEIIEPILIGDKEKTKNIAKSEGIDIEKWEVIDEKKLKKAASIGVKLVGENAADFIMKGIIDTGTLMKEVLNKEYGLRTGRLLSHVMLYEVPTYHKLLYLTDGGMNLNPNIEQKENIIENSIEVAKALGNKTVKIGCLAAKEKLDPNMVATIDAQKLKEKSKEGHFGKEVIVDGPMALDLAISKKAAKVKGFNSQVSGDVDVLLVPNIEMGNGIGKSITYFAGGKSAGVIMGAKVPIVLVSRADSHEAKLYSIALGSLISHKNKEIN